jgi:hypothetical protein
MLISDTRVRAAARRLHDDKEVFSYLFDEMQKSITEEWKASGEADKKRREMLYHKQLALAALKGQIENLAEAPLDGAVDWEMIE